MPQTASMPRLITKGEAAASGAHDVLAAASGLGHVLASGV